MSEITDKIFDWSPRVQLAYVAGALGFKTADDVPPALAETLLEVRRTQGRERFWKLVYETRKTLRSEGN